MGGLEGVVVLPQTFFFGLGSAQFFFSQPQSTLAKS